MDDISRLGGQIHQLEEPVPLPLQAEYFKQSIALRMTKGEGNPHNYPTMDAEKLIFDQDKPLSTRRMALSRLAMSGRVEAYRVIEDFLKIAPEGELRQWAMMAKLECRVAMMSDLVDERQIAVASGLGGRGDLMRFMGLFHTVHLQEFEPFQVELFTKELQYRMEQYGGEVEDISVGYNYIQISFLLPIQSPIKEIFVGFILECNLYGNFLGDSFMVTNSQPITPQVIKETLAKYAKEKNLDPTH
ncbi:hypothetical protein HQ45_06980 [Porphyromonas crevioricanis]|uniref:Uncharacterized protein n=2 Tax=Porphyromonas crevioricanis TaxID=393921 RepID=A0A0A2FZV1_9PORP|nr:hypothetical protein [Porphyromonas crevioricanis]KGN89719.1 hypothetical protein HQ45_06980 [Porphyromonas crevioricanis]KGN93744.1 hypothetical protein HQ38_08165 [Porphyromonas crevioricanis]SJZ76660.1 hypothetical protein SAMN02745203_00791 [Porphyromonas crevioricanis]SQH72331.1 Uncharacterised protein [Porphyromonas crevioricanis]GAD04474.1 hypothetical protein PORCRE_159 [Porphyromonas crevioricanis JCM 15906]